MSEKDPLRPVTLTIIGACLVALVIFGVCYRLGWFPAPEVNR